MEGDQELKHCCNVCGKRCSHGRALGGHKKSHKLFNCSSKPKVDEELKTTCSSTSSSRCFKGLRSSYSLRKNPKKTQKSLSSHLNWCKEGEQEIEEEKEAVESLLMLSENNSSSALEGKEADQELKGFEPKRPNEALLPFKRRKRTQKVVVSDGRCHAQEAGEEEVQEGEQETDEEDKEVADTILMISGNKNSAALEGKQTDQEPNEALNPFKKRNMNQKVVASEGDLSEVTKRKNGRCAPEEGQCLRE